jgi:GT2 family glycosyltransferase
MTRPNAPGLSVVIVTYHVPSLLRRCLDALRCADAPFGLETIVVDAGTDGNGADLGRTDPEVIVIEAPENPGFGAACNLGARRATGQRILFLNPDTEVPPDGLVLAIAALDADPGVGIVGPKLVRADGSHDLSARRSFPTPANALYHFLRLPKLVPGNRRFGAYNLTYIDPDVEGDVDAVAGSFMLVRREALEAAGLFDETYWMYGEDLDLCLRVREAGWRARYVPSVVVTHLKGQSSRRRPLRCTYEFYRAMMLFHWKHRARDASPVVNIAVSAGIICLGALAIVRDRLRPPAHRHVS